MAVMNDSSHFAAEYNAFSKKIFAYLREIDAEATPLENGTPIGSVVVCASRMPAGSPPEELQKRGKVVEQAEGKAKVRKYRRINGEAVSDTAEATLRPCNRALAGLGTTVVGSEGIVASSRFESITAQ
jgi:hypothetical protein